MKFILCRLTLLHFIYEKTRAVFEPNHYLFKFDAYLFVISKIVPASKIYRTHAPFGRISSFTASIAIVQTWPFFHEIKPYFNDVAKECCNLLLDFIYNSNLQMCKDKFIIFSKILVWSANAVPISWTYDIILNLHSRLITKKD